MAVRERLDRTAVMRGCGEQQAVVFATTELQVPCVLASCKSGVEGEGGCIDNGPDA